MTKEIYIVSAVRTPIGSFLGQLSTVPATQLGSVAIKNAIERAGISADKIDEVFMGNVLQAGVGQAPARQASIGAGIPNTVPCVTVNKVCASGMKAMILGTQSILAGDNEIVVAGGMESMSLAPHYVHARVGAKYGDVKMIDGLAYDGLTDAYSKEAMGNCGDLCASEKGFSREDQDNFAINSYKKSAAAWEAGKFKEEVVPVTISTRKGDVVVAEDEEYKRIFFDKVATLKPAFKEDGTVTAANASTINDGASALVLASKEAVDKYGLKPLAKIVSYADAAHEPEWFTTAPSAAANKALKKANLTVDQIDYWELNEAFSVVALANTKILGLDPEKVDVNGGAVSIGHPLGNSGSRIVVTLINVLKQNNGKYGCAAICNGGGGASSLIIERM